MKGMVNTYDKSLCGLKMRQHTGKEPPLFKQFKGKGDHQFSQVPNDKFGERVVPGVKGLQE